MRILVLSDTHIPSIQSSLPQDIIDAIQRADMIFGLGDFTQEDTIHFLKGFSQPFYGVLGNMDAYELHDYLPVKRLLHLEGHLLYMIHGWGSRDGLEERIYHSLPADKPSICFYGHSHCPTDKMIGDTRFINPGTSRKGGTFVTVELGVKIMCTFHEITK